MATTRYKNVLIPSGTAKSTADALAGLGEKNRTIVALWYAGSPSTGGESNATASMVAYKEQDQIVEFELTPFFTLDTDNAEEWQGIRPRVEVNLDLKIGEGFSVGLTASSSISATTIIMEYIDK